MKILRIIARLNVGGPARHVVWLTKELQDGEFQSVLVAGTVPSSEEDMGWFAEENGVHPVFIPEMSRELSARDIVSLYKVFKRLKFEKPDIIHTHTAKAGTIGRIAGFLYRWLTLGTLIGRPRRVRMVHTFHGHVFHSYYGKLKTRVFIIIEKVLAAVATHKIVTITRQQFEEINQKFGVGRRDQFEIIPLGIDLEKLTRVSGDTFRAGVGAEEAELLVGFVGRLTEIKNIGLLLKTARLYKDAAAGDSPRLKFLIIGDGNLRETLEAETKDLGVEDIVSFLGNRDDLAVFYAGLDIVALTSHNEGTPLSLIEAMACGRPVISTGVGGVVDLLGSEEAAQTGFSICERGVRVQPNSPDQFHRGLMYLAKDPKLRENLAAAGQNFARMNYNKERLVNDIKDLYRGLFRND